MRNNTRTIRLSAVCRAICWSTALLMSVPAFAEIQVGGGPVGHTNYKSTDNVLTTTSTELVRIHDSGTAIVIPKKTSGILTFCGEFWSSVNDGVALTLTMDRDPAHQPPIPEEFVFPAGVILSSSLGTNPETRCFTWGVHNVPTGSHNFELFWMSIGGGSVSVGSRTISIVYSK